MSYALLNPTIGVVNKLIEGMGFSPVEWYQKPKVWPTIITLFYIWKIAGVNCIIYYAGLMGIDKAYFEAATLDGASKIQIVFKIMLPFISTIITMMVLLQIGNIFRADFGMFYNLTRDVGALYPTTDVIDTYIFRALRVFGDVGTSSAVGLFQSVVGFVLVVITNWVVKKKDSDAALF
jgi:putative aldouronate transport system permease protein